jgi:hypothetical protein
VAGDIMTIDIDKLREDLINYYGSATPYYPMAIMDISRIESASPEELVNIALENHFDLSEYEVNKGRRY